MVAYTFQQEDTVADSGVGAGCSGAGAGTSDADHQILESGTPGSTEDTVDPGSGAAYSYIFQTDTALPEPNRTIWEGGAGAAGDYVVNLNVTTGRTGTQWTETHICERTSGGVFNTVASLIGQTTAMSSGTQQHTVNRATDFIPDSADSTLYIVCVFDGPAHGGSSIGITPSLTIVTPIDMPAVTHTATAAQTMPTPSQSATGAEEFTAIAAQTMPTPSQAADGYTLTNFVYFDETTPDWLGNLDTDPAGDTIEFLGSFWIKPDSGSALQDYIYAINGARIYLRAISKSGGKVVYDFRLENTSGTVICNKHTTAFAVEDQGNHLVIKYDGGATPTVQMYGNRVDVLDSGFAGTLIAGTIDWTNSTGLSVGSSTSGATPMRGGLQEFYLHNDHGGLDLSTSDLDKFVTPAGMPALLGADGSVPTGTQPLVYLNRDYQNFGQNAGSLGDFTVNGTLTDEGTLPQFTQTHTATAAQVIPTPTQSATAEHPFIASAAQTIPTPSQAATGVEEIPGAVAQTMPTPSQDATGAHAQEHTASAAQTAPTPTQSVTGIETFAASAAQTAPTPSQDATGAHPFTATAAQTTPTPSQAATGAEAFQAAVAQTAPTPLQSATGAHTQGHTATVAQASPTPTQSASATLEMPGTVSQTAPTPTQDAMGVMQPDASVAQTAPTPTQDATGTHASANMSATAAQTAPTPRQDVTGAETFIATAGQTAPTPSQAATGFEILIATAAQTAPTPLQAAVASEIFVGTVAQTAPTPSQSASGAIQPGATVSQTVPTPTQAAVGVIVVIGAEHRAETIMQAVVAAVTGLATTGAHVYRARAWPVQVDELPALLVWQGDDDAAVEMIGDGVIARLAVALDAVAREPADQIDTTLNLIREEATVALMADYTLGLPWVEGILERDAEEPDLAGEGDAPAGRMRMNWDVTYHHGRSDPAV